MRDNLTNGRLLLSPCRCCASWVLPQWLLPWSGGHASHPGLVFDAGLLPVNNIMPRHHFRSWDLLAALFTHSTPLLAADYMHEPLPVDNTTLHDLGFEALPFLSNDAVSEILVYCGALL